ncbi:cobalamin-independent methionine synthase II family protein [Aspergillus aculeatinus CBS 121060]|uniref:5-methyltetrahydropteroyltriglutamate-homocysteine methyltransferase n=1 Tax=Aspergillus aculeatinus CBS 121060 TaxID=1448322 RepID=A0ACD1GW83_9EURO|nr:5-methyltetrahydropteroyltriglutamate-homocysteine methyltransferase [Aspergillus aculeatinus CBS 121060]RAH65467.1 5-methyltetrahydropteroyltriglutamate-homocysteine methyltransferase [Aspergillus aculeatinus CBS 121060]
MAPQFRAEQIGSLLRPDELVAARAAAGQLVSYTTEPVPDALRKITEDAIARVVEQQLQRKVRPIMSGEYERTIYYSGFFERLHGFKIVPDVPVPAGLRNGLPVVNVMLRNGMTAREAVIAVDKIRYAESPYLADWEYLRSLVPPAAWKECKVTIPPITWQHLQLRAGTAFTDRSPYTTDKEYFADLAQAYAQELRTLYDAGLRSIQVDDPQLLYFVTDEFRSGCRADGIDPDELLELYIWAHNQCLVGRPADLHVGIHLCRGNMPGSTHIISGSYERIARRLFTGLDFDTFYLEYDTERAGDFQPLRYLPVDKNVVLGVVSTKSPEMESLDELEARVYAAADVIAQGQGRSRQQVLDTTLGVSPQCGFSSISRGRGIGMTDEKMWEKLQLVQNLAERIWGRTAGVP